MNNTTPSTKRKPDWWIYTIPVLFLLLLTFHLVLLLSSKVPLRLAVFYLGPLLVSFLAAVFLLIAIISSFIKRPFFSRWRLMGLAGLLLFPLSFFLSGDRSGFFFSAYPSIHQDHPSEVHFRLPLDTTIAVAWGGDKASENYHVTYPDQRWAYDLLVMHNGKSYAGDSTKVENYFCYGLPVLAPAAGKVIKVSDDLPDMPIGDLSQQQQPFGNHIVIEVAPGEYLVLCHLKLGSITIKKGDTVEQGKAIARVGNSGHTSEPHLHMHLQDSEEDSFGEGIPLYFYHYKTDKDVVEKGMPTGGFDDEGSFVGQIVRNIE